MPDYLEPWWKILYKTLMRLVMGMASRVLDNSLRADSTFFVGDGCQVPAVTGTVTLQFLLKSTHQL